MTEDEPPANPPSPAPDESGSDDNQLLRSRDMMADVPPERVRGIRSALNLVLGVRAPASNPLGERITSEHITQALNNRENDSRRISENRENDARRAHSAANSERWLSAWFGTLILFAAIGLIVFFGIRETYEVVTAIIGGLLGFAGGFGVGRMRR